MPSERERGGGGLAQYPRSSPLMTGGEETETQKAESEKSARATATLPFISPAELLEARTPGSLKDETFLSIFAELRL